MQFTILFVLMGGLSIATAVTVPEIEKDFQEFLIRGRGNPIDSNDHYLQLNGKLLGFSSKTLVLKGLFDGQEVAVKISKGQEFMDHEIAAYRAANATDDPDIKSKGIPKIYYTGRIFENKYPVIVMTLFDETLYDRWIKQHESFNAYTIIEVFLQLAQTLDYLQSRRIKHNDVKPKNIFLRDKKVFLGDFDIATLNGDSTVYGLCKLSSPNCWSELSNQGIRNRFRDDLESLVFTIWDLEHINYSEPPGLTMLKHKDNKRFLMEKCEHFNNFPRTYEELKSIFYDEMLSFRLYVDYDSIVKHLKAAKKEVKQKTGQKRFEWRASSSSASSSSASSSSSSGSSYTFGHPGEVRPDGDWTPRWLQ